MAGQNVLQEVFVGSLTVEFERGGTMTFENGDGATTILSAVMEFDAMIQRTVIYLCNADAPPYEVVSYDREKKVVVVRRR